MAKLDRYKRDVACKKDTNNQIYRIFAETEEYLHSLRYDVGGTV